MRDASPLRYPGGKWRLQNYFERVIELNGLKKPHYIEPFAGGASLALSLLFREKVSEIHLNDLDPAVYSLWDAVLNRHGEFMALLKHVPITPAEWRNQRAIYSQGIQGGTLALGFASFFLNRTNHSGILNGGMIGGQKQEGRWTLASRFNKVDLERRLRRIHSYRNRISISHDDAVRFLRSRRFPRNKLIYLDPPYYRAGRHLYLNAYQHSDHRKLHRYLLRLRSPWVVSYDDCREIRTLYSGVTSRTVQLLHTAREVRRGRERLYFSPVLRAPSI